MARELEKYQLIERSIIKKYRKELWNPFVECVKQYSLISENSTMAIYLQGDARSTLAAKLMQHLNKISEVPFEIIFFDDGIGEKTAKELNIPLSDIIECSEYIDTVIFDDVVKQTLKGMFYQSKIEVTLPKYVKNSKTYINPLYCIKDEKIAAWLNYNSLNLPNDYCFDEETQKISDILNDLKKTENGIEDSIFKSVHAVCLDTMVGYTENGVTHFYIDDY